MNTASSRLKILIIRLLNVSDVASIGVPALRYFKKQYPEAQISFMTFAQGGEIIELAEPSVNVIKLDKTDWPDNLLPAMESFLGFAEQIVGEGYDQIINLDTSFMACFLTRFLKDAGERVMGNYMNQSVQELIEAFQAQTLLPEYVSAPAHYMDSTFALMSRWFSRWWESSFVPENGYPEYYLANCCGFDRLEFDMQIQVAADADLISKKAASAKQKVIALTSNALPNYPYLNELKTMLQAKGYVVWSEALSEQPIKRQLEKLTATDLLVSPPAEFYWLAKAAHCQTLLITGDSDPAVLMPDFVTEPTPTCTACLQALQGQHSELLCVCIKPQVLAEQITELLDSIDS
ncbi:hypothetical protein N7931_03830 [Catenovulum sp. 2E275]|uniref:glycosyltransferase family 9 protein n=1 Tax=Catenovulum sp. 2E275 TaxID=2980497 RepID=UPI0021D30F2F|nr:hypothetical protein [Catenovulum sp. 2E275]MCU4674757.1 hypothetical protein [Catenovulum sp. 2E275]